MSSFLAVVTQSPNPILPSTGEVIWSVISFVILLAILVKYAFPPVAKMLEKRSSTIRADLEAAEAARREAEALLRQRQNELASAKDEARRIIEDARSTGESLRSEIVARAQDEAASIRAQGEAQLAAERNRLVNELRQEMVDTAIVLASRIVAREIERENVDPLVEVFLSGTSEEER
jgi:F-type H+-transporting ATPase subunit b